MFDTDYLRTNLNLFGLCPSQEQLNQLSAFYEMVVSSNKAFNLTSITEEKDFIIKHIVDSLAGAGYVPQNARMLDIGSGAGFPAVPIAVLRTDADVTALDSTAKKTAFINAAAKELKLDNIRAVAGRAEEEQKFFNLFDAVTARAVSSLQVLLELAAPMLKVGGVFIAYKTDDLELAACKNAQSVLKLALYDTHKFTLPNGDKRALLVFKKLAPTPAQYPRRYGVIKNSPL